MKKLKPNPITAWSYSRLSTYRKCPRQFKYAYVDKLPQPQGPALARGDEIHQALEKYLIGDAAKLPAPILATLGELKPELVALRKAGAQVELEYAVDVDWKPVSWFDRTAWLRAKLDVRALEGAKRVRVIDHKTGKEYPGAHADQLEIYAAVEHAHAPLVTEISAEMFYLDLGKKTVALYQNAPKIVPKLRKKWEKLARPMFLDKTFNARPGVDCRWCAFSGKRGGPCEKG